MRYALAFFALLFLAQGPALSAIYIVRHAEKVITKATDDPPLRKAGKKRAKALARVLRSADLKAVYVTQFQRTQQTAAPTAKEFGLTPLKVKSDETTALAQRLRADPSKENVLVVAHSDTIPDLLTALGVKKSVVIDDNDYDNLFVVDLDSAAASLHWLHYGD